MDNKRIYPIKSSEAGVLSGTKQFNRVKICHVANSSFAVKSLLVPQLKFLIKEGYDVSAACAEGKWSDEIKKEGIKVKNINFSRNVLSSSHFIAFLQLFFYFKKEKFDIVHTHNPVPGLLGQLAAKFAGVPIIINTIHGFYFTDNTPAFKRKVFIFLEKVAAKCSTLIFSQNKEDIKTAVKEEICSPEKIRYLGNGINIDKFNIERFSKDFIIEKKKELGLKDNSKIIGIVARMVKEKGYLELFEACKNIFEKIPDAFLLAIGPEEPGKKDGFNQSIVKDYGIEDKVIFLGERNDVDELYPLMDVFVLPSHREGFPRSLIEASAEKIPIVATNIRGCREAVDNNKTGILIPAKNIAELEKAIIYLFNNSEVAKNMGGSCPEDCEQSLPV